MPIEVLFLFRKPSPRYHSIESLFETIEDGVSKHFSTGRLSLKHAGGSPISLFLNILFYKKSNGNKPGLIHITGDVQYMGIVTGERSILTIHDIQSALKGSFLKQLYIKMFWFWLPAWRVRYITVISDFTRKELTQLIPFAKNKIKVIPNPVNESFKYHPAKDFNEKSPLILCMGTKENKNLERIVEAISYLSCRLHIIGPLSGDQKKVLRKFEIMFRNSVNLSHEEIVQAYQECDMLCFPSTYEGFGMPIIEAQAVGRPVITSDLGAMKEVAGDSACLVDPFDVFSIRTGINRVIQDQGYRENLIRKGLENVKRFDAEVISRSYLNLYQEILES
ncbi:glycosyl transferase family 4 [Algoriphagus boseongensis]|uniref:Glycosyl transferase family 4 n=1 Tax=Algoriphagus boseongensis TaxID=1442587 RepID=A0A4R6TBG7_9BACT|nr:glycosyltransferase family 1 protein [Algoriphagus boseongensis]TDQ19362.1 glycosyl transferase family 4 [Algoriphagus boseongensis]